MVNEDKDKSQCDHDYKPMKRFPKLLKCKKCRNTKYRDEIVVKPKRDYL